MLFCYNSEYMFSLKNSDKFLRTVVVGVQRIACFFENMEISLPENAL